MPKKISGTRLSAYQAKGDATKFPDKRYHELHALGLKLYSPLPIEPLTDNTTRAVVPLAYGGTAPCGLEVSVRRHGAKLWRCRDTRGPSAKTYDLGFCCDVTATAAYKVAQEIFSQAPVTAYPEPPNQGSSGKTPEDNHSLSSDRVPDRYEQATERTRRGGAAASGDVCAGDGVGPQCGGEGGQHSARRASERV